MYIVPIRFIKRWLLSLYMKELPVFTQIAVGRSDGVERQLYNKTWTAAQLCADPSAFVKQETSARRVN